MKEVALAASSRQARGKGGARQSRMAGNIPAVVYGPETDPLPIEVSEKDLRSAVKEASSMSAIFDLNVDGKNNKVLIRELQRDPITLKITHIDFHAISMNKPINLNIPLTIIGTAEGVKVEGGILQTTMREVEISCLPKDIPDKVEIDVSELNVGDSIHVRDLEIPNATILAEEQRTIAVVQAPTVIVEPTVEGEELEEGEEEAAEGAEAPAEGAAADAPDDAKKEEK